MPRRLSLEPRKTGLKKWPWRVNLPANISGSGKRERRFFASRQLADTFCKQQRVRLENFGRNSSALTPGQLEEAAHAFQRISAYGVTLNTVVSDFVRRHDAKGKSITFAALFDHFTTSKKSRSAAYLRGLKYTLPRFEALHDRIVSEIEPAEIESELDEMTPAVRNAFLRNLRAVFNFGVKRGLLENNPILRLDFDQVKKSEVVILAPKDAAALMIAAESEADLLPYHALALFAGVRPLELERLDWRHVDLVERHVEITAEVSKTGRRRIIDMEPNLHAWLAHHVALGGSLEGLATPSKNLRQRLRTLRKAAGLGQWTQDVMRHSYASYWLAAHGDINRLTLQMGHESADMLWKHYHRAAKRKDAATFWKIAPSVSDGRKIVSIATG